MTNFILIILTIILGLLSRTTYAPDALLPYLGDVLYALMFFWIFGFLFPKKSSWQIALLSIFTCYIIEALQLCQADWLNQIRAYKIGGLILGYGFLWSDLVCYTVGGILGWVMERRVLYFIK